ncbi:MAG: LysE family translocator [Sediminispirochaetaceae bacterium]
MDYGFVLKGIIVGFSIAAPVGPMGALCISRSIVRGFLSGFISGLGAAVADALLAFIAVFGVTFISSFLVEQQLWIRLAGVAILSYLGMRILLTGPAENRVEQTGTEPRRENGTPAVYAGDFTSALFLALTNPISIITYTAVFAGFGLHQAAGKNIVAAQLVLGVFLGSALWWFLLSKGSGLLFRRAQGRGLKWVNRTAGAVILLFALLILVSLLS